MEPDWVAQKRWTKVQRMLIVCIDSEVSARTVAAWSKRQLRLCAEIAGHDNGASETTRKILVAQLLKHEREGAGK